MFATRLFEGEPYAVTAVSPVAGSALLRNVGGHSASRMKMEAVTHWCHGMTAGLMFAWQK